ncbi:unnamed protein product, partial [Prorocentrum cordatum]
AAVAQPLLDESQPHPAAFGECWSDWRHRRSRGVYLDQPRLWEGEWGDARQ